MSVSHLESIAFFRLVAEANASLVDGASVLEVGSFDVNGGIRGVFSAARDYTGVDLCEGPGVDVVSPGHELSNPDGSFDITLSTECFEHNPFWRETFVNMIRMTRPGGLVVFSCASRGRVEHGTTRTDPAHSPGTQSRGLDYYRNLNQIDFEDLDLGESFSTFKFWYLSGHFDLLFVGVKRGEAAIQGKLPEDSAVEAINGVMSLSHKVVTSPLRGLSRVLPDERYQPLAIRTSKALRPFIMFEEYRRNSANFTWSGLLRDARKRAQRSRLK